VTPLWVYKCNTRGHAQQTSVGDWDEFFRMQHPNYWGGTDTMRSKGSLHILWHEMAIGDHILCWQSNRRAAVGLCRVTDLEDWTDAEGVEQRTMWLELIGEPFSPPVPLLDLRKADRALAAVRAFEPGFPQTLYGTTNAEARAILRACGISPSTLERLAKTPAKGATGGAGFGTAEENRKVELAAIKVVKAKHKAWSIVDRQADKVGYDLELTKGRVTKHVEVKGARGPQPSFVITEGEVLRARSDDSWHLAVVTDALTKRPRLTEWTAEEFLDEFELKPVSHMAKLKVKG
jgi:hypothetical protein